MREDALRRIRLPDEVWDRPETAVALRERRIGYLFGLAKKYAGASQTRIANVTGMDQSEVSRVMRGDRRISAIDVLERVAVGLTMPDRARVLLGLAPSTWQPPGAAGSTAAVEAAERDAVRVLSGLPAPLTGLIGRETEIGAVTGLLAARRLVTLAGAPGIGKTRLAVAVAEAVVDRFEHGVVFVSLAEAESTDRVVSTIARALDVTQIVGQPLADTVAAQLAGRQLLLVLDNFEQVLEAAPLVGRLVAAARGLRVLVTSRERLRVAGEQVYPVPPLSLPSLRLLEVLDGSAALLMQASSSAVALFADRAAEAAPGFAVDERSIRPVAELCHRLDGLPLAIELAAARVGTFTPEELLASLSQRLDLIAEGPRDVPSRQRTLHAAIAWSFALLDAETRALFARLSVFGGGCLAEAAHRVCMPSASPEGVAQRLAALVEKNVVRAWPDPEGRTRYGLLETIRVFAAERLAESGDADELRARHAENYADFASRATEKLVGPAQALWMGRVDREYANLQAALGWALAHDRIATAGEIAVALQRYWLNGRDIGGGRRWYDRILATPERLPADLRVRVLLAAAHLACWQSDLEPTRLLAGSCLGEARLIGDLVSATRALHLLAVVADEAGDYEQARVQYEECLGLWRELGDARGTAAALVSLGDLAFRLGDLDTAAARHLEGLDLFDAAGDSGGVLTCLFNVGEVRVWQGDADTARPLLTQALAMSRDHGDRFIEAAALDCLGRLAGLAGDAAEERRLCADGLEMRRDTGEPQDIPAALQTLAGLALADAPAFAVRLLGAGAALRERLGLAVPPVLQPSLDGHLSRLHHALDDETFAASWAQGHGAPLDETIAQALAWARSDSPRPSARARE